ncbi:MAG: hypothetical protein AAF919_13740 [Pseudomonadota bacterium]
MPLTDPNLWAHLQVYDFPADSGGVPFQEQLIRETGWSAARSRVAVREYRRFLYLAGLGTGRTVPSKIVDAVWHQHLGHTREYWERFCPDVLRAALHHKPGSPAGHGDDYARTLRRYAAEFDSRPTYDVWIRPDIRARRWAYVAGICLLAVATLAALAGGAFAALMLAGAGGALVYRGRQALTLDLRIDIDWDAPRPKRRRSAAGGCGSGGCGGGLSSGADSGGGGCGGGD